MVTKESLITDGWECIPNYEERYWVSEYGTVWSLLRDRQVNPITHPEGYKIVRLSLKGKEKQHKLHQIVCRAFHGKPMRHQTEVDHINGIKHDNRAVNLRWCDTQVNAQARAMSQYKRERDRLLAKKTLTDKEKAYLARHKWKEYT